MLVIKRHKIYGFFCNLTWLWITLLMLQSVPVVPAIAKDIIYINPFQRKTPVAVTQFMVAQGNSLENEDEKLARQILTDALAFTGYLNPMNPVAFLADPSKTGVSLPEINFRDWTGIGAELLITGKIEEDRFGNVSMALRLMDPFKSSLVVGNIYSGKRYQIREIIHKFCSDISLALTGKRGVFTSKIAFVSTVNGNKEIFTCDFDGHGVKQFTAHKSISLSPAWSSDGKWLAYVSFAKGGTKIFVRQVDGKLGNVIGYKGTNSSPAWMPGKLNLAASMSFSNDPEIYLLTRQGEIIKRITESWGIDVSPSFSPDGKKIVFASRRHGSPQIYIKDLKSGAVRRLTFKGKHNTSPSWSPDGKRIAYVGIEDNQINIFVINVGTDMIGPDIINSGMPVQLTVNAGDNEDPCWSPDGSMLIFSSTRNGGIPRLFVMNASGTDQRQLLKMKGRQTQPDWSLPLNIEN